MTKNDLDIGIFLNNVDYFCRLRDKKISDLERENGVSAGYFSRLRKKFEEGSPKNPKLGVALATAVNLRVPLEILSTVDFSAGINELKKQVLCYIGEIIVRTGKGNISWSPVDIGKLVNYPGFQNTKLSIPLDYPALGAPVVQLEVLPPNGNGCLISRAYFARKDWQTDLYYVETIRIGEDLFRMNFPPMPSVCNMELWMHINGTTQIVMNAAMDNDQEQGHAMRALQNIITTGLPKIPNFGTAIMNEITSTISGEN